MTMTKISRIDIKNVLGITEFSLEPGGSLTEIVGTNGQGKTSILDAIKAATQGGHDATLLKKGAEKGEIVLVLDDGTSLHKQVTATGSTLDLIQGGKKVPRPAATIKALTDMLSVNPVEFLTAKKQDRVQVLLEAMPISVDMEKLSKIVGFQVKASPTMQGLAVLDMIRKQVFDERTSTNRAVMEKDNTINQLTLALPDVPDGLVANEDQLRADVEAARDKRDAETKRIDGKLAGMRVESQGRIDKIKADAQAAMDEIKKQCDADCDTERAALAENERKAGVVRQKAVDLFTTTSTPINDTLTLMKANRDAFAKREQTQVHIKQMEQEHEALKGDAERQTAAIDGIDAYKSELLASLPIPGVEVRDGEVYRDGIVFDRLNTAQQVDIAIEIAKLRSGTLAVCCVDRFECLAPDALEEFRARAADSGLQLFVTRVESGPLEIRTQ
jgi:ABC-type cobalamin/Fe3+-siderophores transport system ATPase subunit